MIQNNETNTISAIAVKSGPSVFNADSKKRQEQNFYKLLLNWHSKQKQDMKHISAIVMEKRKNPAEESLKCIRNWLGNVFGRN